MISFSAFAVIGSASLGMIRKTDKANEGGATRENILEEGSKDMNILFSLIVCHTYHVNLTVNMMINETYTADVFLNAFDSISSKHEPHFQ